MRRSFRFAMRIGVCLILGRLFLNAESLRAQDSPKPDPPAASSATPALSPELKALAEAVRLLQTQVQALNAQLNDVRAEGERVRAESRALRRELDESRLLLAAHPKTDASTASTNGGTGIQQGQSADSGAVQKSTDERLTRLEEDHQLTDAKVNDQYQTKVESGSKYRVRLSGMVLLNLFGTKGSVDNQDVPVLANPVAFLGSPATFGGSLRQSQIGIQVFGPDVAGAKTRADLQFDFGGGFPNAPNGATFGLMRLRTGTVRFDWTNTSIVAGQDHLFFSPLTPTSIATLAVPAFSYSGALWGWLPQVRVEHKQQLTENSKIDFQFGILDSMTGDFPNNQFLRSQAWGEQTGQPAYAGRVAWSHRAFGQQLTVGMGGFYGRQDWGFGHNFDGWGVTGDLLLPLGKYVEVSSAFFRGRAVGGFGGGIGQVIHYLGSFIDPATRFYGLDAVGGWAQLKVKPRPKFEINGAFGQDNPYAAELAGNYPNYSSYATPLGRNRSAMANFIYQPKSNVMFSVEFRRLRTFEISGNSYAANHLNLVVGYIF